MATNNVLVWETTKTAIPSELLDTEFQLVYNQTNAVTAGLHLLLGIQPMLEFRLQNLLVCLGLDDTGPSEALVETCRSLRTHLSGRAGRRVNIRISDGVDALCVDCPSRHGTLCDMKSELDALDGMHLKMLGLKVGDVLTFGELRRRMMTHIGSQTYDQLSERCPWKEYGATRRTVDVLRADARRMTTATTPMPPPRR